MYGTVGEREVIDHLRPMWEQRYPGIRVEVVEGNSPQTQERVLTEHRRLDAAHAARIRESVVAEIEDAVAHAEASPLPRGEDALNDLFAYYPWAD